MPRQTGGYVGICHVEIRLHMQIPNSQDSVEQTCTYYDVVEDGGQKYIMYGDERMSYWAIEGVKGIIEINTTIT